MKYLIMGSYLTCPDDAEDVVVEIPLYCSSKLEVAKLELDILREMLRDTKKVKYGLPERFWIYTVPDNMADICLDIDAERFGININEVVL